MVRRLLIAVALLAALFLSFIGGLIYGALIATRDVYHRRYLDEREQLAPLLSADPAFSRLEILERSDGGAELVGEVANDADRDRLRSEVARVLGTMRVEDVTRPVASREEEE